MALRNLQTWGLNPWTWVRSPLWWARADLPTSVLPSRHLPIFVRSVPPLLGRSTRQHCRCSEEGHRSRLEASRAGSPYLFLGPSVQTHRPSIACSFHFFQRIWISKCYRKAHFSTVAWVFQKCFTSKQSHLQVGFELWASGLLPLGWNQLLFSELALLFSTSTWLLSSLCLEDSPVLQDCLVKMLAIVPFWRKRTQVLILVMPFMNTSSSCKLVLIE